MTRHVIIGRFGADDTVTVPVFKDEVATELNLCMDGKRLDWGIGKAIDDLHELDVFPTEVGLDLLVVAAMAYVADTRISRETESQDSWTRELRLTVPVSDPARWIGAAPLLRRMLSFLTGDLWTLDFRARPAGFATPIVPRHGRAQSVFDSLSLFSGGLDSLIGAIDLLEAGATPLFISHAGEGATSDAQSACFDLLKAHYASRPFDRLRVWMNFPDGTVSGTASEKTTRRRSFLFLTLGVLAGTGLDKSFTLQVFENGLISLNVPLDPLRLGALSTRTTHPFYMARWNELLAYLRIPGRVENPYDTKTKGEMVTACKQPVLLKQIVPRSLSCSSPTKGRWQGQGVRHCGYCLPCIIRRAALEAAWGRGVDPTVYGLENLRGHILDTRHSEGQQIRSFQLASARLRAKPGLEKLLIHKPGSLADEHPRWADLAGVYRRGMLEVEALLAGVRTGPV